MPVHLVLLIDDDPALYSAFAAQAVAAGWRLVISTAGVDALALCRACAPAAIVLEGGLPGGEALRLCRTLRALPQVCRIPILYLGTAGFIGEREAALAAGVDEYLRPPFNASELADHLRLCFRYTGAAGVEPAKLSLGPVTLDRVARTVSVGRRPLTLTITEYRLLEVFLSHPQAVLTRQELIVSAWSDRVRVAARTVDVCVTRLRRKLETECAAAHEPNTSIRSVRGFGYMLAGTSTS
jgi:DNA-binding response OmpR family regulator